MHQLQLIVDSKKTTSRVRFMMRDVIDLRKASVCHSAKTQTPVTRHKPIIKTLSAMSV
jgi:hypothetical protein